MQTSFEIKKPEELRGLAQTLKESYPNGGVFLLYADLGYGKSALVKAFASLFGLEDEAASPTFSIMNEYGGKIFHYDFYNFGVESYFEKAMFTYLDEGGWHFMEWADEKVENFLKSAKIEFTTITISKVGKTRVYEVKSA